MRGQEDHLFYLYLHSSPFPAPLDNTVCRDEHSPLSASSANIPIAMVKHLRHVKPFNVRFLPTRIITIISHIIKSNTVA